jgi:hypothetical protein
MATSTQLQINLIFFGAANHPAKLQEPADVVSLTYAVHGGSLLGERFIALQFVWKFQKKSNLRYFSK